MRVPFKIYWFQYHFNDLSMVLWFALICSIFIYAIPEGLIKKSSISLSARSSLNYESIGQGPFFLNPQYLNPSTPKVLESLYAFNGSRLVYGEDGIHVGTLGHEEGIQLKFGAFVPIVVPSETRTQTLETLSQWALKSIKIEKEAVLVEARHAFEEPILIKLPLIEKKERTLQLEKEGAIQELKEGLFLGDDELLKCDPSSLKENRSYRLKLTTSILNLKEGISLFYRNGAWTLEEGDFEFKGEFGFESGRPVCVVCDQSGFAEACIPLDKPIIESFDASLMVPNLIRQTSEKNFSCFLGRQRLVLKEGDWVLKQGPIYRILRSRNDLEAVLSFEKTGLLLVIETMTAKKDKTLIQGRVFSPLRTKSQSFEFETPIFKPKPQAKPRHRGTKKGTT